MADIFRALGQSRDHDAIQDSVIPLIKEVCDFDFALSSSTDPEIANTFKQYQTTQLFLSLLSFIYSENEVKNKLSKQVSKSLTKLYHKILKDASQFPELSIEQQHQKPVKRVKQLRYCIDFTAGLYPEKQVQQFLDMLQPIQEYLGFYNDLFVAEQIFQQQVSEKPEFLFVLGWVKAQQPHVTKSK